MIREMEIGKMNYKMNTFEKELKYIKDDGIRNFTEIILESLPDYFFEIPASSSGRFHPSYALGEGGLVRHTKAAVGIAQHLFGCDTITGTFSRSAKDCIIAALILHDGVKKGVNGKEGMSTTHPILVTNLIKKTDKALKCITNEELDKITKSIESHMGQWNYDFKIKKAVLPKPKGGIASFVHMCDYLASRKSIEYNFEV